MFLTQLFLFAPVILLYALFVRFILSQKKSYQRDLLFPPGSNPSFAVLNNEFFIPVMKVKEREIKSLKVNGKTYDSYEVVTHHDDFYLLPKNFISWGFQDFELELDKENHKVMSTDNKPLTWNKKLLS